MNQERSKRGYDIFQAPIEVIDKISWLFDIKLKDLPEFNTQEEVNLFKTVRVWTITHLITPAYTDETYDVVTKAVFTNKEDALNSFKILQEYYPEETFFLNELSMNKEIELYLPEFYEPDWYKELKNK